jgi:hypothetical protein
MCLLYARASRESRAARAATVLSDVSLDASPLPGECSSFRLSAVPLILADTST